MVQKVHIRRGLLAAGGGVAIVGALALPALGQGGSVQQADPPGDNGTIKIDGVAFDDHPNNEPHVGCTF